jgi:hypothetical protein
MVKQKIRRAYGLALCLGLLLLLVSPAILFSDEKTELQLLEQALSVCYTAEEQDTIVRVFLNETPSLEKQVTSKGVKVSSIPTVRLVECGTLDILTVMEVICRLDEKTRGEIIDLIRQPPDLDEEVHDDHFMIHYTTSGDDATTDEFANSVLAAMADSRQTEIGDWGYEEPTSGSDYDDGRYHVYISRLISADGRVCSTPSGDGTYVEISRNVEGEDESRILSLCGHEYHHAIQFEYINLFTTGCSAHHSAYSKRWAIEGSAEWMEHEIFRQHYGTGFGHDALNSFTRNMGLYLDEPYEGLESWAYETVAYWFFIADNSRVDFSGSGNRRIVNRRFWEAMQEDYERDGMAAWDEVFSNLDETLSSARTGYDSLDKSFKAFVQSNYFKDIDTAGLTPWYDSTDQFTQDMSRAGAVERKDDVQLSSSTLPIELKSASDPNDDIFPLDNYSSCYFEIENDTSSDRRLRITFSGDSSMFWKIFSKSRDEKTEVSITSNSASMFLRQAEKAVVMVGRLSGGSSRDYTLKIEEDTTRSVDLIFVIDVTGSMWDDIDAVKASATIIVDAITSLTSDFRVGIVAYRDHPIPPYGDSSDVMFEDYAFSMDKTTIINNINSLTVSGGADWEEAVYDALLRAIDSSSIGGWRSGARKVIILMGDAPPHDPCPIYGYTLWDVIIAAYLADPAQIYGISIGYDPTTFEAFEAISEGTDGEVFSAPEAGDVVDAILKALGTAITGTLPHSVPPPPPPDYNEMIHPLTLENINRARELQVTADNLVKDITSDGKEIPREIMSLIELAETYLEKAEYYKAIGNFIAANYWAIRAQELFREAINGLNELNC